MYKKTILRLLVVLTVLVCFWTYDALQKPVVSDVSAMTSTNRLETDEILALFQGNEDKANATYTNKVIEVHGVIKEISFLNHRKTIILASGKFKENFVICDMSPLNETTTNTLLVGDTITLKGICKGYLLDLILLNCIPINEKPKN